MRSQLTNHQVPWQCPEFRGTVRPVEKYRRKRWPHTQVCITPLQNCLDRKFFMSWYRLLISKISHTHARRGPQNLEWNAGRKEFFDDGRLGHQTLQPQVEDPLERLLAERPQHLQLVQDPAEVVRLLLRVRVVGHVVAQRVDDLRLETLYLLGLQQAVAFYKNILW